MSYFPVPQSRPPYTYTTSLGHSCISSCLAATIPSATRRRACSVVVVVRRHSWIQIPCSVPPYFSPALPGRLSTQTSRELSTHHEPGGPSFSVCGHGFTRFSPQPSQVKAALVSNLEVTGCSQSGKVTLVHCQTPREVAGQEVWTQTNGVDTTTKSQWHCTSLSLARI